MWTPPSFWFEKQDFVENLSSNILLPRYIWKQFVQITKQIGICRDIVNKIEIYATFFNFRTLIYEELIFSYVICRTKQNKCKQFVNPQRFLSHFRFFKTCYIIWEVIFKLRNFVNNVEICKHIVNIDTEFVTIFLALIYLGIKFRFALLTKLSESFLDLTLDRILSLL